jgi:hypothetical protein
VTPQLQHVGNSRSAIVIIDDFTGAVDEIARIADSLAPFPPSRNYYPGVRRMIEEADEQAYSYVLNLCEQAAPFIGGAFDVDSFRLTEASFSVVSTPPDQLHAGQRAPHFDTFDPRQLALLHYLRVPAGTGTAFYRHRSTAIERVTDENRDRYLSASGRELEMLPADSGYICGSDRFFEQIGKVDAVPDRLIIYPSTLLHSGVIPRGMRFSADPREGRLTANLFVVGSDLA